ncbi:MAG: histidine kinase [Kofleriaceae bacterium]
MANRGMHASASKPGSPLLTISITLVVVVTQVTPLIALGSVAPERRALLLGCIAVLVVGSTAGVLWAERARSPVRLWGMLAALCVVGGVAVWASQDVAWQVVMPLISLLVLFGSAIWGVAAMLVYLMELLLLVDLNSLRGLSSSGGFLASSAFVIVFSLILRRERDARASVEVLAADLEHANGRLRDYATQVEDLATAKERNRLAREIHDSLGHYLTVVHVQLEAAKTHVERDPAVALRCLAHASRLTQEGLTEVRRSVALLRASPIEQRPLHEAVGGLLEELRASGLEAELIVRGAPQALDSSVEFALYRAAQESLTNIRRHARAQRARLELCYETRATTLRVTDDGVGAARAEGGFGLLGLRERVQLVGGTVDIQTAVGAGFSLAVEVPR